MERMKRVLTLTQFSFREPACEEKERDTHTQTHPARGRIPHLSLIMTSAWDELVLAVCRPPR